MSRPRLIALLLALATLLVFLPVVSHDFQNYDDDAYITDNVMMRGGLTWKSIVWAFTTFHVGNWHPLTWLSHLTDCELFGLNPGAHHLINVLWHAANSALLFVLLWRLTTALWPAALVAALFAWHPMHVESVAWIAERKDVLSTFFALLALLSYTKYVQEQNRRSLWFALGWFALGLLAKPMLVTLPFVLLLLDFWPLKRFLPLSGLMPFIREKWSFFVLTTASCIVTFWAQHKGHAVASLAEVPLRYRLECVPLSYGEYLWKIFWPARLAVLYPLRPHLASGVVMAAFITLVLFSGFTWQKRRTAPYLLTGWWWFLGTLVPVIGLVQVGGAAMADRYSYLPSIGIFIIMVFGLHQLAGKTPVRQKFFLPSFALLLSVHVGLTEKQLSYWRNSETLFRQTLAVTENNDLAHLNLAIAMDLQDRNAEALAEYQAALKLAPERHQIHYSLGRILDRQGHPAEALGEYLEHIKINPEAPFSHNAAGCDLALLGREDEALREFAEAAHQNAHYAAPHIETAKIYFQKGSNSQALAALQRALQAEPDNFKTLAAVARFLAANENTGARDGRQALKLARQANELTGGSQPLVWDILGMAYAETGDFTNAITSGQNALDLAQSAGLSTTNFIQQRLVLYHAFQPWHESFLATNSPIQK